MDDLSVEASKRIRQLMSEMPYGAGCVPAWQQDSLTTDEIIKWAEGLQSTLRYAAEESNKRTERLYVLEKRQRTIGEFLRDAIGLS